MNSTKTFTMLVAAVAALALQCRGDYYSVTNRYPTKVRLDTRSSPFTMSGVAAFAAAPAMTFGTNDAGTVTVTPAGGGSGTYTADTWRGWGFISGNGTYTLSLGGDAAPSGSATFTVSGIHAGTVADPEVYTVPDAPVACGRDGLVFTLSGTTLGDLNSSGYCASNLGDGLYRLDAGSGNWYDCTAAGGATCALDTRQDSAERVIKHARELVPIAYTADDWAGVSSGAVTLTLTSPKGVDTVKNLNGTGGLDFRSGITSGLWRVAMGGETATILFSPLGSFLSYQ